MLDVLLKLFVLLNMYLLAGPSYRSGMKFLASCWAIGTVGNTKKYLIKHFSSTFTGVNVVSRMLELGVKPSTGTQ